jgi:hypothetical protein
VGRRTIFLFLVVAGCSSTLDTADGGDAAADAHKDSHVVFEATVDEPAPTHTASGRVVDSTGAPWPSARMQICASICYQSTAGTDGTFSMNIGKVDTYAVDATGAATDGRSASRTVYSHLIDQDVVLGDIVVEETGAGQALSAPKDVAIDADLTLLAVDPSALALPAGVTSAYAAGVRVAKAAFPTYDTAGKTVVAMWALNPFSAKSSKPVAVTIKNSFGLAANAKLAMRAVDDTTGLLLAEIPMTVSSDAMTITTDSGGLDRLTWIVLVQ